MACLPNDTGQYSSDGSLPSDDGIFEREVVSNNVVLSGNKERKDMMRPMVRIGHKSRPSSTGNDSKNQGTTVNRMTSTTMYQTACI